MDDLDALRPPKKDVQGMYCVRCGAGNGEEFGFCQCEHPNWDSWIMPTMSVETATLDMRNYRVIPAAGYRYLVHGTF